MTRTTGPAPATATLLVLADGRLPTGGHVHSGGMEEAVTDGRVGDVSDLRAYVRGRLATAGLVDAALAGAGADLGAAPEGWAELDSEAAARCPASALRQAGRSQGRGLVRVARRLWPAPVLDTVAAVHADGPLWPVAVAAAAVAAGVDRAGAALVAAQASVTAPGWAAVRLLGLDPFAVALVLADLAPAVDMVVAQALDSPAGGPLPAASGPLCDIAAQIHARRAVRLFAS
ncbi:MAG: urease accessory protein UreF [Acidimicrobiales bacterium]